MISNLMRMRLHKAEERKKSVFSSLDSQSMRMLFVESVLNFMKIYFNLWKVSAFHTQFIKRRKHFSTQRLPLCFTQGVRRKITHVTLRCSIMLIVMYSHHPHVHLYFNRRQFFLRTFYTTSFHSVQTIFPPNDVVYV